MIIESIDFNLIDDNQFLLAQISVTIFWQLCALNIYLCVHYYFMQTMPKWDVPTICWGIIEKNATKQINSLTSLGFESRTLTIVAQTLLQSELWCQLAIPNF